ncbi:MAG TPA: flagellar hook-associated protein FlgK [Microvirga sp.]|jgi:flagellar hook-associated protein 1 FlgK|nr:flagellar hook-associated protein FlgK [Microvirga sp.]
MGLMMALNAAVSGLRTTQAAMNITSQNVANANSAGYTRRVMQPIQQLAGDQTSGVRTGEVSRTLNVLTQRQLRLELAGANYTGLMASYAGQLDKLFGTPGGPGALDTIVNDFTRSLQTLVNEPGSSSARNAVLDQAGVLASQLARLSDSVQGLRTEAEGQIGIAVDRANELLTSIASVNQRILANPNVNDPGLLDERDRHINELSALMDVQATYQRDGSVTLATTAGLSLFNGMQPVKLSFDGRSTLVPQSQYSTDSATRTVGTITASYGNGVGTDVIANGMIRSGEIAGLIEMRDKTLVQAQRQLDELAAGMSRALSDYRVDGTAVAGPPAGLEINFADMQPGNTMSLEYTQGGVTRRITLVATEGGAPAMIAAGDVGDPGALVIPFNPSAPAATTTNAISTAMSTAFGAGGPVPTISGLTLRFVAGSSSTVGTFSAVMTETDPAGGRTQIPLFVDSGSGNQPFTGSFEGGSHLTGLAQRLAVNPALLAERHRLVVYDTGIMQGDATRPRFLLDSLTKTTRSFSPAAGLNGSGTFSSTVTGFARRTVEFQGAASEHAKRLDEGQNVALAAIESRYSEETGVNIDQEMAQLVQLQTAYGANARVMTAVRDMMDLLMRM